MLQDDESDLQEGTQLFLGLIDRHRGTKRKISLDDAQATPSAEEAQAESEARRECNGSNDASRIPEEESLVMPYTRVMVLVDGAWIF